MKTPTSHPVRQIEEPATVSMILESCIKDIEQGQWICGQLCKSTPNRVGAKPMGCAVGLVGINGGVAELRVDYRNNLFAELASPDDYWVEWPVKARQAVLLLAQALPKDLRPYRVDKLTVDDEEKGMEAAASVIAYNDGDGDEESLSSVGALEWFKRAHELALDKRL